MGNTYQNYPTKGLEKEFFNLPFHFPCARFRECTLHQNWSSKDEAQEGRQT